MDVVIVIGVVVVEGWRGVGNFVKGGIFMLCFGNFVCILFLVMWFGKSVGWMFFWWYWMGIGGCDVCC